MIYAARSAAPALQPSPRSTTARHPWRTYPIRFASPDPVNVTRMLRCLYRDQAGYAELAYIDGDPRFEARQYPIADDGRSLMFVHYTPGTVKRLAQLYCDLVARFGNVYVSLGLYRQRERSLAALLPLHALFIDDGQAIADLPATMTLQTSANSQQLLYLLTAPIAPATYQALEEQLTLATGGAANSKNPLHLIRLVGAVNTKQHGAYTAHVSERHPDARYHPDDLVARLPTPPAPERPAVPPERAGADRPTHALARSDWTASQQAWESALDWEQIWALYASIDTLLDDEHLPRRLFPTAQARHILTQDREQRPWEDTSSARWCVCQGLIRAGYGDAEIAALLLHFCEYDQIARKSLDWLRKEITRCILKGRARRLASTRSQAAQSSNLTPPPSAPIHTPAAQPVAPNRKRGRRADLTARSLLAWMWANHDAGNVLLYTVGEIAAHFGVSRATIERLERQLRKAGQIVRHSDPRSHRSWLALVGEPIPSQPPSQCTEVRESTTMTLTPETAAMEHTPPTAHPVAPAVGVDLAPNARLADELVNAATRGDDLTLRQNSAANFDTLNLDPPSKIIRTPKSPDSALLHELAIEPCAGDLVSGAAASPALRDDPSPRQNTGSPHQNAVANPSKLNFEVPSKIIRAPDSPISPVFHETHLKEHTPLFHDRGMAVDPRTETHISALEDQAQIVVATSLASTDELVNGVDLVDADGLASAADLADTGSPVGSADQHGAGDLVNEADLPGVDSLVSDADLASADNRGNSADLARADNVARVAGLPGAGDLVSDADLAGTDDRAQAADLADAGDLAGTADSTSAETDLSVTAPDQGATPPPPRRRSLRELVCLALDDDRRASLRRVREYVADNGGAQFAPAAVERTYRAELERRGRERKLAALKNLGPAGLRAEIRLAEYLIDKSRAAENDSWRWWTVYRDLARRELASRPPDPARPRGGRKNCERLPDLRALGEREQARLWATAEAGLADLRAEQRGRAVPLVRCAIVESDGGDAARGLIARLKARRAEGS